MMQVSDEQIAAARHEIAEWRRVADGMEQAAEQARAAGNNSEAQLHEHNSIRFYERALGAVNVLKALGIVVPVAEGGLG